MRFLTLMLKVEVPSLAGLVCCLKRFYLLGFGYFFACCIFFQFNHFIGFGVHFSRKFIHFERIFVLYQWFHQVSEWDLNLTTISARDGVVASPGGKETHNLHNLYVSMPFASFTTNVSFIWFVCFFFFILCVIDCVLFLLFMKALVIVSISARSGWFTADRLNPATCDGFHWSNVTHPTI